MSYQIPQQKHIEILARRNQHLCAEITRLTKENNALRLALARKGKSPSYKIKSEHARVQIVVKRAMRTGIIPTCAEAAALLKCSRSTAGETIQQAFGKDTRDSGSIRRGEPRPYREKVTP